MTDKKSLVVAERILAARGQKAMLDADLAELYGVETKRLNEQVRRNSDRFPEDFMFRLTADEHDSLRSQSVTLKSGRGQHRKYLPFAFTEHGALMLGNVLKSPQGTGTETGTTRTQGRCARQGHRRDHQRHPPTDGAGRTEKVGDRQ